ncbi:MAG: serine/threonine protein kinase [Myxococcota bacterium]|jgi:serine/threonine protein kinase
MSGQEPPANSSTQSTETGRYRVIRELGEGAAAVVYLVELVSTGEHQALKALRPELAGRAGGVGARERFLREAASMARLQHPHIVPVFAYGASDRRPWLAMEFIDGPTLGRWIAEHDPPRHLRLRVLAQIAEALAHAHEHELVHRDLKPANVLVGGTREDPVAKVADFGVVKVLDAEEAITIGVKMIGTPRYMSPEQALGEEVDARSDVYALGVMAWGILAGRPLWKELADQLQLLRAHLDTQPPPIPGVEPDLDAVVQRALQKDPDDRWPDAATFAQALRAQAKLHGDTDPGPSRDADNGSGWAAVLLAGSTGIALAMALGGVLGLVGVAVVLLLR